MKVKQPRRWKKHTVQEQGEISNRFSGRILWAMLLLGGIGTLIALGISGGSGTPQNSSRTISDSAFQKADEKLTAAFPARNLFLRTLTNGIAATGGNRIGDVYFTEERLLECPKQLDAVALSDTADAINQFYTTYQIPTAVIAVPPAGEFYADDLLDEMSYPSQRTAIDSFYQEISSPVRKIDVYHVLFTATNDYIYYRTDAKWSSYGAYCVYRNAIQRMGFAPISYDQYTVTHVASFRGNLYDACLYSKVTPDILDVYQNENGSQITEMTAYPADGKPQKRQLCDTANDAAANPDAFYLGDPCEKS
ncbi:MAG: DHHW family protein [Ruminococcus sp.]